MKYETILKKEKGVVGLEILLSIVSMLFVIGILVMAFTIAGSKLQDSVTENSSASLTNSTMSAINEKTTVSPTGTSGLSGCAFTVTKMYNASSDGAVIDSGNWTLTGCSFVFSGDAGDSNNSAWNITGSYTWNVYGEAVQVINETKVSLQDVPGWFSTYIVMASIVVIILLVVIIINAVKGGGLMGADRGA